MDKGLYFYSGNEIIYSDDSSLNFEYNTCYECVAGFKFLSKNNACIKCATGCLDCDF
jgi:hypothetical protein